MIIWILMALCIVCLILVYPYAGAVVIAMGVGNDRHFNSQKFQVKRLSHLMVNGDSTHAQSVETITNRLLPPTAKDATWSFDTGDDSWLVTVARLRWRQDGGDRYAVWVIRYCLDWKWREHFIEAASLNDEAEALTPSLNTRRAIYGDGTSIPMEPRDHCNCIWQ